MLEGKKIILGVTGSIAAYKSALLLSELKRLKADVWVVMTNAATSFITPLTLQTLSKNKVYLNLFDSAPSFIPEHISLNQGTSLILIAPATANTISKISLGIADNLLSTLVLSSTVPKILAPAMNEAMYLNPIFQENLLRLVKMGYILVDPECGRLACEKEGKGRMGSIERIIEEVKKVSTKQELPLKDRRILITAGPTREPLDTVRYLSNRSSGKMGYALAEEAQRLGGRVTLISGPSSLPPLKEGVKFIKVTTALEMREVVLNEFDPQEIVIFAAAVSDFRSKVVQNGKIRKKELLLRIELVENPDILKELGSRKKEKILVGFAAEDSDDLQRAVVKLEEKNLDFIVFNNISREDTGFESDTNQVKII
ncbi:bifunctional phosphopantothenoylcysteine decarboxylase/phosphopantothenate--cysteine ligase CoaBC, partial [bacterium]|nr:bifunctional phosphopantothenoylcysteine decarboxylase/phosphopantothenate--cysteine ligase CoaBC [bacterium]